MSNFMDRFSEAPDWPSQTRPAPTRGHNWHAARSRSEKYKRQDAERARREDKIINSKDDEQ
jgi:hypothetical protein